MMAVRATQRAHALPYSALLRPASVPSHHMLLRAHGHRIHTMYHLDPFISAKHHPSSHASHRSGSEWLQHNYGHPLQRDAIDPPSTPWACFHSPRANPLTEPVVGLAAKLQVGISLGPFPLKGVAEAPEHGRRVEGACCKSVEGGPSETYFSAGDGHRMNQPQLLRGSG